MKIQTKSETKAKTAPDAGKVSEGTGTQQASELVLGYAASYPVQDMVSEFDKTMQALKEANAGKAKSRKETAAIQDSGERTVFPSGAVREKGLQMQAIEKRPPCGQTLKLSFLTAPTDIE